MILQYLRVSLDWDREPFLVDCSGGDDEEEKHLHFLGWCLGHCKQSASEFTEKVAFSSPGRWSVKVNWKKSWQK